MYIFNHIMNFISLFPSKPPTAADTPRATSAWLGSKVLRSYDSFFCTSMVKIALNWSVVHHERFVHRLQKNSFGGGSYIGLGIGNEYLKGIKKQPSVKTSQVSQS